MVQQLDALISRSDRITVITHAHPDGDAIGSAGAMKSYLETCRGKKTEAVVPDSHPDFLSFIFDGRGFTTASEDAAKAKNAILNCDLIIVTDASGANRLGDLEQVFLDSKAIKVLIDHHLGPLTEQFDLAFSDANVSSACELLYSLLLRMPDIAGKAKALPAEAATSLMTGMTTDTNNFANSVFPATLKMASELLGAGVDRGMIIQKLYNECRENRVRAFASYLGRELTILDNGLAYMILRGKRLSEFDISDGETEGLVNVPLTIGKVRMSLLLKEDNGYFRVSLRSRPGTTVRELAMAAFHGGGHAQASGGRLYFPEDIPDPDEAARYVEEAAARFLQGNTTEISEK